MCGGRWQGAGPCPGRGACFLFADFCGPHGGSAFHVTCHQGAFGLSLQMLSSGLYTCPQTVLALRFR